MNNYYDLMLYSETIKVKKTHETIKGLYKFIPNIYDVLIQLVNNKGELAPEDDMNWIKIQDSFQFFIFDAPYKIRSIFILLDIANYGDAVIIYRSLVETYMYYKFFIRKKDGDGLQRYIERTTGRSIKDVMDGVCPGFYDTTYQELCNHTHGNPWFQAIFRGNVDKDNPLKFRMDNINLDWYSYISNQVIPLIQGIINLFQEVYPNNTLATNATITSEMKIIKDFVYTDFDEREKLLSLELTEL